MGSCQSTSGSALRSASPVGNIKAGVEACGSMNGGNEDIAWSKLSSKTRVKRVTLLVRALDQGISVYAHLIDGFITSGNSQRLLESVCVHFAIELVFENDERLVIERLGFGVCESNRQVEDEKIATESLVIEEMNLTKAVTLKSIRIFCDTENGAPFSLFDKDCKHFATTSSSLLCQPIGSFPDFTEKHERVWNRKIRA